MAPSGGRKKWSEEEEEGGDKKGKSGECFPALEGQANTFKRREILLKVNLMFLPAAVGPQVY